MAHRGYTPWVIYPYLLQLVTDDLPLENWSSCYVGISGEKLHKEAG